MKIVGIHLEEGGVGWHRCWNWTSALERMGHEVRHHPHSPVQFDWADIDNYLRGADIVITHKMADAKTFAALHLGRKLYGYKLVVDTDDNADLVPPENMAFKDYHAGTNINRLIRMQYREADLVTVTTENLKRHISKYSGNIVVMPNVVDPRIFSGVVGREKEARHRNDIRIYWGGGAGHYSDLLMVKDVLLRLFNEDARIKLVFSNFVPDWAADLDPFRVFMIPFVRFSGYPRVLKWLCADIAIAPLVDTEFNAAKSNVKYLDYAMADIPGVYSNVPAYESVRDGETGLKCSTLEEWHSKLSALIADRDLRTKIATQAKQDVLGRFTIDRWAPRYETMLVELMAKKPVPELVHLTEGQPLEAVNV